MTKQITKNQHYVPQCLLKGFAINEKINIFDITTQQHRDNQLISKNFSQNYFYDYDTYNQVEEILSKIESKTAPDIERLRNYDYSVINNNEYLIRFLCAQYYRTRMAQQIALKIYDFHAMNQVKNILTTNKAQLQLPENFGDNPEDFGYFDYNRKSDRLISAGITTFGVIMYPVMTDLKFHVLINKSNHTEFIISDNPVIMYNWLYKNSNHLQAASPLISGVQFFMPISKNIVLCAYDPKVYKYGNNKKLNFSDIYDDDINWLNQLQIRSSTSMIGYSSIHMQNYININKKNNPKKILDLSAESSSIIKLFFRNVTIKPSFFKIQKKAKYLTNCLQYRNNDAMIYLNNMLVKIKKGQEELLQNGVLEYE